MKIFLVIAIIGAFAIPSEGMIRMCFPVTKPCDCNSTHTPTHAPTVAPTSAPTVATTIDGTTTTVNTSAILEMTNNVTSANQQFHSSKNAGLVLCGSAVLTSTRLQKKTNMTTAEKQTLADSAANLSTAVAAASRRRRRRQTSATIPETCAEAEASIAGFTYELQSILAVDFAGIITYLETMNDTVSLYVTVYPTFLTLVQILGEAITMLQASTTYRDFFAAAVQKLVNAIIPLQDQLCKTLPGETSTLPTTISIDLGTSSCSTTGTAYMYKAEMIGAPITAGPGMDGRPTYISTITHNDVMYPGGLMDQTSIINGMYFTRDYGLIGMAVNNVTYLEYGDCNCYWIAHSASLGNAHIVNFNSGYSLFGIGRIVDSTTLSYSFNMVGRIELTTGLMKYMDYFKQAEQIATTYEMLVCESGAAPTTEASTTVAYTNHTVGIETELSNIGVHIAAKHAIEEDIQIMINSLKLTIGDTLTSMNLSEQEKGSVNDMLTQLTTLIFTPSGLVDLTNCPESCMSCFALVTPITQVKALGEQITYNLGYFIADINAIFGNLQFAVEASSTNVESTIISFAVNIMKQFIQYIRNLNIELDETYAGYLRWFDEVVAVCGPPPADYSYY